ncbi:MAG: sterol desaturase/sphingolipid hydroxylase (fatty acid hydroxylase superfamily) [Candidatus Azotimanducaceae bacterium]|jgi:sterol desaturase/sphingolipid hydroxylase (fatty acid hydroxylase superfamily)
MNERMNDDLTLFVLPLFALAMLVEIIWSKRAGRSVYLAKDTWASLSMLVLSALVELVPRAVALLAMIALHELSPLKDIVGRQWWAWLILFLLDDLIYYWFHRCNHEVRLFWAGHVNHHSSQYLNFGTALRQGVGERVHKMIFWLPLPLLGFDVGMILLMISINLFYQFWVHTEAIDKLPKWFEAVFNTPSHHRVHHASNVRYLDCNHAGVLIIWDKLFGTFSPEVAEDPPVYGLTKNIKTHNPWRVLTHEYASLWHDVMRAPNWKSRWRYLFLGPGWSHDGPDKRARTQRQAAE